MLQMPGGNTTTHDACAEQFGVQQSVFGTEGSGVSSIDDCENLPESLQAGCRWRFDWFKDALYPRYFSRPDACPRVISNVAQRKFQTRHLPNRAHKDHWLHPRRRQESLLRERLWRRRQGLSRQHLASLLRCWVGRHDHLRPALGIARDDDAA